MRIIILLFIIIAFSEADVDRGMRLKMESESKIALLVGNSSYSKSQHFENLGLTK